MYKYATRSDAKLKIVTFINNTKCTFKIFEVRNTLVPNNVWFITYECHSILEKNVT